MVLLRSKFKEALMRGGRGGRGGRGRGGRFTQDLIRDNFDDLDLEQAPVVDERYSSYCLMHCHLIAYS